MTGEVSVGEITVGEVVTREIFQSRNSDRLNN